MSKGSVEDRLAIRELIETFAVGVTTIDPDLWGSTWAPEGCWKTPSMPAVVEGKEAVVEKFKQMMAYINFMSMSAVPSPTDLVFDGDKAIGRTYCRELIFPKAGGQKIVIGFFDDEYVKRDGQWLFTSRLYTVIGAQ
ncbi:nuclear transport factor 2 family protein [Aestuariicella hydrocarbonica]|uniref:Nuclear transport factor 2 family protein n=1 Tax=Pseudomaricurvus hydrocarbonicus TaxID=1470433 RepID=A0A9E5K034_9GAMM|nr:nuclear transport factor 2 family protein [Aestuariicella hydrocarbonica]NHO65972.1 nuclear transport factor 2 family protein [Aestuariicella hydrocarbonica]